MIKDDKRYYLFGEYKLFSNKRISFIHISDNFERSSYYLGLNLVSCDAKGKAKIKIYDINFNEYKEITLKPGQQYSYTLDGTSRIIKHRFVKREDIIKSSF